MNSALAATRAQLLHGMDAMYRLGRSFTMVLVLVMAIGVSSAAVAHVADQAAPDLEDAIRLYALPLGFAFRGECAAVPSSATTGMCYEATIRADGNAEVWLTALDSGEYDVVLFAPGNPGWYPFTPGLIVSDGPGINTRAQLADVAGIWTANGALQNSGTIGLGSAHFASDGSGAISGGRFEVARLQLGNFQDGIAVGSLTIVRNNVNPTTNAITGVTDVRSAPCAVIMLNDGSLIVGSVLYGQNWRFTLFS